jgi:hypothetical protein
MDFCRGLIRHRATGLFRAIRVLSAEGGRLVPGRTRASGKRSKPRLEPVILGQARGASGAEPKGGRRREDARHDLVMRLAVDWYLGTGVMPESGRSGEYNFAGQYQQSPAPLGGGLVKAEWFKYYGQKDRPEGLERIVQSWDTANKVTETQ